MNYLSYTVNNYFKRLLQLGFVLFLLLQVAACQEIKKRNLDEEPKQIQKTHNHAIPDSLMKGTSYLSIYSQIYNQTEHKTYNLTATVSIRNVNRKDTIYIENAEYFNTEGRAIRRYFDQTVYVAPMETIEIVIDEMDKEGGTGANFLFDWAIKPKSNEPLFEAVMISSYGQGLSFTTQGKKVNGLK